MTDLNKKEKITAIASYIAYSAVLTYQRYFLFSIVYFLAVAVSIVSADKIISENATKHKTLSAFLITAISYPTMFEIFFSAHNDLKYILTAIAVALFFVCVFAFTDPEKLLLCIIGAPVLCCLNVKIAICYSVFLACWSIAGIRTTENSHKAKSKNKRKESPPDKLAIISAVVSAVCVGMCILLVIKNNGYIREDFSYLLTRFKNPPALLIIAVYLLYRLLKSDFRHKKLIFISLSFFVVATALVTAFLGWSVFALMCTCMPLFLGLICIKDTEVVNSIKIDFTNNKFIFFATIIFALQ